MAARIAPGGAGEEEALRCRCAPRPLADYYRDAGEVVAARVVGVDEEGWEHLLRVEILDAPWKWEAGRPDAARGDTVRYRTASSSAACGLAPAPGESYLLFGAHGDADGAPPRVDSCSGSRPFGGGGPPSDFIDVPAARVHAQLDALSGMDALARSGASTPDPGDPHNTALLGLVELPGLAQGGQVTLRDAPDPGARVVARVSTYGELEAWEVDYEVAAAAVFGRNGEWYRVRLVEGGGGWVGPGEAGSWFPFPEVVVNRLNYLTEAWSGHLWPEPGAGLPQRSPQKGTGDREEYPAEVLEARDVGGTPWIRVRLLDASPCFAPEVHTELEGWIPARGDGGRPTAWYYSRGC